MRLGIITLQPRSNYGGILQAYALQNVLKKMGHEATLIDSNANVSLPLRTRYLIYFKRAIRKYLLGHNVVVIPDRHINIEHKIIVQHTAAFIKRYINTTIKAKNFSDIRKKEFDGYIVGSDQIWRPAYFHTHIKEAFLHFARNWNVKRIAYAASFGTDEWEYTPVETALCSNLAKKFDAISVRESSAVEICKKQLGVDALHVLDPTMLLTAEDYIELFRVAGTPKSPGNLMCYILDTKEETTKLVTYIANTKKLVPHHTNAKYQDTDSPIEERIQQPVESWLRAFYDAEFVVTDSFHACVFSILFKKPFIVYGNKERGMARFHSLLSTFGLEDRLVSSIEDARIIIDKTIDWEKVYNKLGTLREKSRKYLIDALEN